MKTAVKPDTFPLPVTRAGVTVRIYRIAGTNGYSSYQVADYSNGNRKLKSFSDLGEAKSEAKRIAAALARGDAVAASLRGSDAASYARAVELLKPTGVSIEVAAAGFASAFKVLGGDRVLEAAKSFAKRHPATLVKKSLNDAVDEFLEAKRQDGAKERYLQDLDYRLGKLRDAFHCDVQGVTGVRLDLWLRKLELSPQSRLNFLRVFSVFFQFCIQRGWLPKDWDELDGVTRPKVRHGEVTIYTPEEMGKLLTAAPSEFVPVLAIAAFAGVRSAELERLSWTNIDLEQRHIKISVGSAKTASRRIVPIVDNLAAWLCRCGRNEDMVWPFAHDELYDAQQETARKAGIKWKHNAARHTFVSCRLALIQDAAKVALEAGNSPEMVFEHYRELVTPAEAAVWFAITPENAADVTALRRSLQNELPRPLEMQRRAKKCKDQLPTELDLTTIAAILKAGYRGGINLGNSAFATDALDLWRECSQVLAEAGEGLALREKQLTELMSNIRPPAEFPVGLDPVLASLLPNDSVSNRMKLYRAFKADHPSSEDQLLMNVLRPWNVRRVNPATGIVNPPAYDWLTPSIDSDRSPAAFDKKRFYALAGSFLLWVDIQKRQKRQAHASQAAKQRWANKKQKKGIR